MTQTNLAYFEKGILHEDVDRAEYVAEDSELPLFGCCEVQSLCFSALRTQASVGVEVHSKAVSLVVLVHEAYGHSVAPAHAHHRPRWRCSLAVIETLKVGYNRKVTSGS